MYMYIRVEMLTGIVKGAMPQYLQKQTDAVFRTR